ncbi:acyltransferase [Thioclava sp. GXIMD4216]|uniref:acyltransferase family protein n=1 Tax=Thioclava sp. GXIMD4216 TaxID=3131929 RepID=UPI0030D1F12D
MLASGLGRTNFLTARNPETTKLASYPMFDWLRFVLASLVVMVHAHMPGVPGISGGLSVGVFFALSGWLIGSILLRTSVTELPRFFFNRATRIWLPYAAAIALLYGAAAIREGTGFFWLKYLVMDLTFTHQIFTIFPVAKFEMPLDGSGNQFWSLSVEEQFYLWAPLVMIVLPWGRKALTWVVVSAVLLSVYPYFGIIALGVLAAILQRDYDLTGRLWVRRVALLVAVGLGVPLFGPMNVTVPPALQALFCVSVVLALSQSGPRSSVGKFLGGISFPLYLNHWLGLVLCHGIANQFGQGDAAWLPLVQYAVAFMITLPMYLMVDCQVMKRRSGWYTAAVGRRMMFAAYTLFAVGMLSGVLMYTYGPHAELPQTIASAE